jgi:NAD-dependent SIR2 family protein deacetylase
MAMAVNRVSGRCVHTSPFFCPHQVRRAVAVGRDGLFGWRALQAKHGGLVKPNIVFFGEQLPARFFEAAAEDLPEAHALIVMGTSLKVRPK